jgi:LysR family hydrogen peroxide-inducible transcriptional activator
VTVFERANKRVLLTPRGEAVVRQAPTLLAEARRLLAFARGYNEPLAGSLRLGAIATFGPYFFPQILRPLRGRFPKLTLILSEGRTAELLEALDAGGSMQHSSRCRSQRTVL